MSLPFRQIHLDFHTAQNITNVGAKFDAEAFADTLAKAHVNSINCFARCHHGYLYFGSERHPERVHPHLQTNLLKEQIEACHARGIKVPIYTTIQWDYFTARAHPEWLALDADGRVQGPGPYEAGFRHNLTVNSPYFDFLKAHVAELFELLPVDGFWFDIVKPLDDSSSHTRRQMIEAGLDPSDPQARKRFGLQVITHFKNEMSDYVRSFSEDCTIFYNEGHVSPSLRGSLDAYSHLELESIPSGEWGYIHFPVTARYARTLPKPYLGMTGKFHTEWGDFHSYKNLAALQYECFLMLALGARCSVGDQLHPNGQLDAPGYDLVGKVYAEVAQKEPWCEDVQAVTEIGVLLPEAFGSEAVPAASTPDARVPKAAAGACRMLEALGYQFDFVSSHTDWSGYQVLLLPDEITLTPERADKLEAYLKRGGKVVASYRSGLLEDGSFPVFFGLDYKGEAPYSPDFLAPQGFLAGGLPAEEYVMYLRGAEVTPASDAEVLSWVHKPYFNRTFKTFMSHKHAPSTGEAAYPGVTRKGGLTYFAHPLFSQYQHNAPQWCRTLLDNTLRDLLGEPLVMHSGPSTLQLSLNRKASGESLVLHLLHYLPLRRSDTIDIIEDIIPLYDLGVSISAERTATSVTAVPAGESLDFEQVEGRVSFRLPKLNGHQMVELRFG